MIWITHGALFELRGCDRHSGEDAQLRSSGLEASPRPEGDWGNCEATEGA